MESIGGIVFVTGAGGFIGPAVVRALLAHGARVRALLGAPGQSVRPLPPEVKTAVADITDTAALDELARGAGIAVHMAGPASVSASFECPAESARVHVAGTAALLEVCRRAGVRRFVYVSSAEVYGRTEASAVHEDFPLQPRSPYGAAKAGAEQVVGAFARAFGLQVIILRPFSVYGPGLSPSSLIGKTLRMAQFEDSVVLNDLRPIRDYGYVEDLVDAVLRSCTTAVPDVTILNIGTGRGTSVEEIAELILARVGRRVPLRERPGQRRPADSEIYRLVADSTRAREVLGWQASTSLETGLGRMIEAMVGA